MDASEFKQRFMPFHRRLYRVGYHLTGNAQDAEDLLQDTYLKLWQKRDDLRHEAITEAYLVTLMQNLYKDQRRLKRIDTSEDIEDHADPPDERSLAETIEATDEARQMGTLMDTKDDDGEIVKIYLSKNGERSTNVILAVSDEEAHLVVINGTFDFAKMMQEGMKVKTEVNDTKVEINN